MYRKVPRSSLTRTHPVKLISAPAYTSDKQVYHTDVGVIIPLSALEPAAEGGASKMSSGWYLYNSLVHTDTTRPDSYNFGTLAFRRVRAFFLFFYK